VDFEFGEDADMVRLTAHEFVRRDLLPQEPKFLNSETDEERAAIGSAATGSLKEMGMYSAGVPEQFGGGGLGPVEACLIAEELNQTIIPVEYGDLTPVLYDCSDAQKPDYLAPVVAGDKHYLLAFNDRAGTETTATPSDDGHLLDGLKLLPRPDADFYLVFARAGEGQTCFIVNSGTPGSEVRTGQAGSELALRQCRVAPDTILGQPGKALSLGRRWFPLARITRAAAILGTCQRLLEATAQYAHDWTQMNTHISDRKAIQQTLADMTGDIEALRWLVYRVAWLAASGRKHEYDSMLLKLQAQRVLADSVNRSIRIHGGTMPPLVQWLSSSRTPEEATDMLRVAVARETISRLQP
jgi:alkylation response protein AidB-like acyl-CoA dehydrogenase